MLNKKISLAMILMMTISSLCLATVTVDFDNFELSPNSHWGGAGTGETDLKVNGVSFPYSDDDWAWSGFVYSKETDVTTNSFTNQFSAITGQDVSGTGNYGVAAFSVKWWDDYSIDPLNVSLHPGKRPHGSVVSGAYFTNTTYTYLTMRDGDAWGFSDPFGGTSGDEDDYLKLIIRGIDTAGNYVDSTVEFFLGDYRFADNSLDYLVDEWTWIDLSALGAIAELEFSLEGSDAGMFGLNTPAYFAMDNLTMMRGNGKFGDFLAESEPELSATIVFVPEPATIALLGLGVFMLGKRK
ncbi:MAG: DUF4465 domain-containing protein [Phycisphaerae bacterium]|nr:DUF4465 domain-containing protein [Phycisphaerae bacterium]